MKLRDLDDAAFNKLTESYDSYLANEAFSMLATLRDLLLSSSRETIESTIDRILDLEIDYIDPRYS